MDYAGWHTRGMAVQNEEGELPLHRGSDTQFLPVTQVEPVEDAPIRGRIVGAPEQPSSHLVQPDGDRNAGARLCSRGPSPAPSARHRKGMMDPYLQVMCGPLLRYDIVDNYGVWHGAALIVTADAGSTYDSYPTLKCRWDPTSSNEHPSAYGADLGPHPTDSTTQPHGRQEDDEYLEGPNVLEQSVRGTELHAYGGRNSTFTFWRFLIEIPLSDSEMKIQYSINDGSQLNFFVPGRRQTMHVAAYSCNGFIPNVNPDDFRGPGFQSGYDPLWVDLLAKHAEEPFHLLVGGGDQLYCDGVALEPELQEWINHPSRKEKMRYPLTPEILDAIDRFYFNHYCRSFGSGAFARANSSIPMLNMLDDNDMIDGFGSYPDELQKAPVFNTIGSRGYFFYLLFQCFINVSKDGIDERSHPIESIVIGVRGEYIPYPSHSILTPIGPTAWLLMLDCRAERKLGQVCSEEQYARVFERMNALPPGIEHLIVQLGTPIVYPRMAFLERILSSKYNIFITLARSESSGFKRFVNRFNGDAELLDDLNDQWTSKRNMRERNMFIERLQQYALSRRIRISFLTGDVHCASVGRLKTLSKGKRTSVLEATSDHRYMLNIVSSAIVNTPPPITMLTLVNSLATKHFRELQYADTDEEMVPLFEKDTDGSKPKSLYIMGRRNWCRFTLNQASGDLLFDIRVEKEKGCGETVGYSISAPPPRWTPKEIK